jgi:hypothetical protein
MCDMRRGILAFALLVAGCNGQSTANVVGGGSSITFWKDVKPLMDAKCTMCHYDGGIAPFAFDDYATVISHVSEINVAVSTRVMPPWLAAPGCNSYVADRSLSDEQIKTITDWISAGADEGNPADYVAGKPDLSRALSRVDLSLSMPTAYTPQLSPDDYRCFVLPWTPTGTKYVTGFRANPGNKAIVHHVIAYLAQPSQVAAYQAMDGKDGHPGYTCFGGPGGSGAQEWIGSWAPGAAGYDEPEGTGILIPAGSAVVLQVHYNTATTMAQPDTTSLDFKIDDSVQKQAFDIPWTDFQWVTGQMDIPAGSMDTMHAFDADITQYLSYLTTFNNNQPITVYGTGLHMHTHGIGGRVDWIPASGATQCLLDIPRWDFHWQGSYGFTQPFLFNPGDKIHLECHHQNMTGTTDLNWGEGTGDEMCLTGFYITQ